MILFIGSLPTPPINVTAVGPKFSTTTQRITDQVIEEVDEQLTIQSNRAQEKRPTAQSIFASSNEKMPLRSAPIDMPASHHNEDKISFERVQSVAPDYQPYLFPNNEIFSTSAPEENMIHVSAPKINISSAGDLKVSPGSLPKEGKTSTIFFFRYLNSIIFIICCPFFDFIAEEDVDCTTPTNQIDLQSDDDFEQLRMARERERLERQKQKIARSVSQQTGGSVALDSDLLLEQLTNSKSDGINRTPYPDSNT